MAKLEDNSHAAQIMKLRGRISFRIYKRDAVREQRFCLMVIKHDDVRAAFFELGDFISRSSAAIQSNEQLRSMPLETTRHAFPAQPVTFFHAQRQEQLRRRAVSAQRLSQQGQ